MPRGDTHRENFERISSYRPEMWEFRKDPQRSWYWKEVDEMGGLLRRSAQYFRERIDCVAHAMRNGYVHPRQRALVARRTQGTDANRADPRRQT